MKRFATIGLLLLTLQGIASAQDGGDIFAVYLVRHAERVSPSTDPRNPPLSSCGERRARSLATLFSDVELQAVYSTAFERTLGTARPTADSKGLQIENYDPGNLEALAKLLINRGQDALVVGHSNTTGVLAGLLGGQEADTLTESEFDRMYQVIFANGRTRLYRWRQAFRCPQRDRAD